MERRDPAQERDQTDASLKHERTRTDAELTTRADHAGGASDDVIQIARDRAHEVLATARAREAAHEPMTADIILRNAAEDSLLASEYEAADLALRDERTRRRLAVRQLLALERRATDARLTMERAMVDDSMVERAMVDALVHDLRSMLSVVSLSAASLILAADKGEPVHVLVDLAHNIQRATAQTDVLLGDLHELAKLEHGEAKLVCADADVVDVVRTAVEINQPAAATNRIALTATLPDMPIRLSLDAPRFMRVIVNLLSNALKFTPPGGSVVVDCARRADSVEIAVADTGPGVPSELHDVIFERFRQGPDAAARGLGLGLYIARAIVEAHGGRIWVESRQGTGATFRIRLPIRHG